MSVIDKLKLGKHYRMERFSALFTVLLASMIVVTSLCFVSHMQKQDSSLSETAIYSTKFTASKTGVTGTVENVYTSKDKTKTFLLLKFENVENISTNANNYQMFLTGASVERNKQTLDGQPSGSIYMFGNTGYMGVYLVNKDGFNPQILDLVIRGNAELQKSDVSDDIDEEVEDASFAKHDQFRVYFNPGAAKAEHLACLDSKSAPSAMSFYNEAVVKAAEAELHTALADEVDQLRIDLNQIVEREDRVKNANINLPARPQAIAGDTVVENKDGSYTYKPATLLPGGYNLDWQNTSVTDGFLADLIDDTDTPNMTTDQYFAMMSRERNGDASENQFRTDIEWTMKDGTLVSALSGSESGRYTELQKLCSDLTTSWNTYYSHKKAYQTQSLEKLLALEVSVDAVRTNSSINTDEDVLRCY